MRSNIIQMLLNASSGKGGSSSEWTIVHWVGKEHPSSQPERGVTFKDKSGKYYYVQAAYDVTQTVPGHATNYGAYGFADLLPWQGATTTVTSLGSKETIDLETKDPNGRPKVICLINSLYYSDGLPRHIFNTDGSASYLPGGYTSNSNYGKTTTLPGGSTDAFYSAGMIAIQVPPEQIVSMTYWSEYDQFYIVQDQSMTIEENVNNWKMIGCTKIDFSKDRLMKWAPVGSNCKFFSETDDFGLTIQ